MAELALGVLLGIMVGMLIIAYISTDIINKFIKQNSKLIYELAQAEEEIKDLKNIRHEEIKRNYKLSKVLEQIYKTMNDEKLSSMQCNVKIKELLHDCHQNSSKV